MFLAVRGLDGSESDVQCLPHELRMPANEYERRRNGRFSIDARLLLARGTNRIIAGLLDENTRQTSYQTVTTILDDD